MRLEIGDAGVGKEAVDQRRDRGTVDEIGVGHHPRGVEGAQRDRPDADHLGNDVDRIERRLGAFAHEDRVAAAERRFGGLMLEVEQDRGLAGFEVAQFGTVGEAARRGRDQAMRAVRGERRVGQAVEPAERRGIEAEDTEGPGELLSEGSPS